MKIAAVIPVRMGSSRFPGKPLAKIRGLTMIEHIYRRVSMTEGLDGVYVATCDEVIREAVEGFGGKAMMTADTHQRASDRTAEAAGNLDADIVVMIQGDEPLVHPEMVRLAAEPLVNDPKVVCSNLTSKIRSAQEFRDPNTIKVVMDKDGFALYFSREPIPTTSVQGFFSEIPIYKQVCIIPFRRDFLLRFARLAPTPLEVAESIDMLRAMEHGYKVKMIESDYETHAVDTPEDLRLVEQMMEKDPLLSQYT
ncbi:MAG: 3-deoxy-manno-octulosonate cytidylyltransferase [bacterium]|nr:3-deoxy-manno-octulosonate cytidylyltransferase [bacterium]